MTGRFSPLPLDTSFGLAGKVVLPTPSEGSRVLAKGMAATEGSAIYVAVAVHPKVGGPDLTGRFGIVKLGNDGELDTAYGADGFALHPGPYNDRYVFGDLPFVLRNGRVLLECHSTNDDDIDSPFLALLESDGSLDPTFGVDGIQTLAQHGLIRVASTTPMEDGRILLIGVRVDPVTKTVGAVAIRLQKNGLPDASFGQNGVLPLLVPGDALENVEVAAHEDESFIIGGKNIKYAVIRKCLPDGSPDSGFAVSGVYNFPAVPALPGISAELSDILASARDGFIGIGTETNDTAATTRGFITCIDRDGQQDPNFAGGKAIYTPAEFEDLRLTLAIHDHSGRLLVAGHASYVSQDVVLGRYDASGLLDVSFAGTGYGGFNFADQAALRDVKVQGQQGILVSITHPALGSNMTSNIFRVLND
jgi:uncharacterized delta-60 repeat protein